MHGENKVLCIDACQLAIHFLSQCCYSRCSAGKTKQQGKMTWESHDLLQQGKGESSIQCSRFSCHGKASPGHRDCGLKHQNGFSRETRYCTSILQTWHPSFGSLQPLYYVHTETVFFRKVQDSKKTTVQKEGYRRLYKNMYSDMFPGQYVVNVVVRFVYDIPKRHVLINRKLLWSDIWYGSFAVFEHTVTFGQRHLE